VYVRRYAVTTHPAWLNPWRALTMDTSDVLTMVVSSVESSKLIQRLCGKKKKNTISRPSNGISAVIEKLTRL
jgi:hypothetical protein